MYMNLCICCPNEQQSDSVSPASSRRLLELPSPFFVLGVDYVDIHLACKGLFGVEFTEETTENLKKKRAMNRR